MRVVVTDSGVGNVRSVVRAVQHAAAGAEVILSGDPAELRRADVLVVPGQGSFAGIAHAMEGALGETLVERIRAGVPYLGICLGLHVLFEGSDEAPGVRGLGVLRGRVAKLAVQSPPGAAPPGETRPLPLPHIGWNEVTPGPAGAGLLPTEPTHFYFAHSYAAVPAGPSVVAGTTTYGAPFVAAVAEDGVFGVQFHPEKSQASGLALLGRFFARHRRG